MFHKLLLALALLASPVVAHAEWHEASSKHFVVYSDEEPQRVKQFAERLERFDLALRKITATPDRPVSPSMRVTVFFVEDVGEIQRLIGRAGVAGFYNPRSTGPVAFVPRRTGGGELSAQLILMHEYGHSFMFSTWPDVVFPPWFVEGFAEFVGTANFRNDGNLILGRNPDDRRWCVGRQDFLRAKDLVRVNLGKLDDYATCALYARGWLLTHYLLLGGHAKEFGEYLGAINAGKSVEEATKALGDLDTLDNRLNNYGKRAVLPSIMLTPAQLPVGDVTIRKLTAGEAATMQARILSTNGVNEKTAPSVADLARRAAAPYPTDAGAQNELAEAEFDTKNYGAAEAAATRALAADPRSVHAMLYKGMAIQEQAKQQTGTAAAAKWKEARSWFVRANKAETEYPAPLIAYYDSFVEAKESPSKAAQNGLLYAYRLAPFDLSLRLRAGRMLLDQGQAKPARVAFEMVAYSPHAFGGLNELAKKVVGALDTDDVKGAIKILDDADAEAKKKQAEAGKKAG